MSLAFTLSIPLGSFLTRKVCLTNRQQSHCLPITSTRRSSSNRRFAIVCNSDERQLSLPPRVRAFASIGGVSLTVALVNRLVNTPILTAYQARADIVAVVCGVSLLVYAAGAVEVKERGQRVRLEGTETEFTSLLEGRANSEARFVTQAALNSVQNFTSAAIFVDGRCVARQGIFRNSAPMESLVPGEAVRRVVEDNKLGYFADLRVMPTREIEFGFFPRESQVRYKCEWVTVVTSRILTFTDTISRLLLQCQLGIGVSLCLELTRSDH